MVKSKILPPKYKNSLTAGHNPMVGNQYDRLSVSINWENTFFLFLNYSN